MGDPDRCRCPGRWRSGDRPGAGCADVTKQEQRGLGRPLEIVEDEQDGAPPKSGPPPGGHRVEEAIPSVRARPRWLAGRPGAVRDDGKQPGKLATVAAERRSCGARDRLMAERLDERLVRHAQVLVAATGEHKGPRHGAAG